MKQTIIILSALCFLLSASFLHVWEVEGSSEIFGDEEYTGKFDGFEEGTLHIKLDQTGERISLPLAEDVEYLYEKTSRNVPYDPEKLIFQATIKAIVVDEKVVQVIVLEVPS